MITQVIKLFEDGKTTYTVVYCDLNSAQPVTNWLVHFSYSALEEHVALDEAKLLSCYKTYADYLKDKAN